MKAVIIILALAVLAVPVFAINIDITPTPGSTTEIANLNCGGVYSGSASMITIRNNGAGGVLCWYNSSDSPRTKLTTVCVLSNDVASYPIGINMPVSGDKDVNVQLECYEFPNNQTSSCKDSYGYSDAVNKRLTCTNSDGIGCLGHLIDPIRFALTCDTLDFNITARNTSVILYAGQSALIPVNVTNIMNQTLFCDHNIGQLYPNQTSFAFSINATASANGSGTIRVLDQVTCVWTGGRSITKPVYVDVSYRPDPCTYNIENAQIAIANAANLLDRAEANITAAAKNGTDVIDARNATNASTNALQAAAQFINTARNYCNIDNRTKGSEYAVLSRQQAELSASFSSTALKLLHPTGGQGQGGNQSNMGNGNVTVIAINSTTENPPTGIDGLIVIGIIAAVLGLIIWAIAASRMR